MTISLSLQTKLLAGIFIVSLFIIIVIGWGSFHTARSYIKDLNFQHLKTIRETKKIEIEGYFRDIQSQCLFMASTPMVINAMHQFQEAFDALQVDDATLATYTQDLKGFYIHDFLPKLNETVPTKKLEDLFPKDPKTIILQTLYLAHNPNPLAKKYEYNKASDGSTYSTIHAEYHDIFSRYIHYFGFLNLYLVDINSGHVVFNISKEIDFGANLIDGPLKDTSLALLFKELKKTTSKSFTQLTDFTFYDPSYGIPAAFIGTPIYDHETKIGCLIFQLPINTINNIMTYDKRWREVGLGDTGETYIIGPQKLMRTISRPFVEDQQTYLNKLRNLRVDGDIIDKMQIYKSTILLQEVAGEAGQDVVKGNTNTIIGTDYLKEISLSSYTPLNIPDVQWGILAEIDLVEELVPIKSLAWRIVLLTLLVLIVITIAAIIFIRMITKPLEDITKRISQPMIGLKEKITVASHDEIGAIAHGYNAFTEKIAYTLYRIQTISNTLATTLQKTTESTTKVVHHIEHTAELTNNQKEMLKKELYEIALLHKQCQDLEKQLHDTLERVDM